MFVRLTDNDWLSECGWEGPVSSCAEPIPHARLLPYDGGAVASTSRTDQVAVCE